MKINWTWIVAILCFVSWQSVLPHVASGRQRAPVTLRIAGPNGEKPASELLEEKLPNRPIKPTTPMTPTVPFSPHQEPDSDLIRPLPPVDEIEPEVPKSYGTYSAPNYVSPVRSCDSPSNNMTPGSGDWFEPYANTKPCWFGSVAGLYMTRDHANRIWTTVRFPNVDEGIMHTQHADSSWAWGTDVRLGRSWNCNNAWEAGYWGLYGMDGAASVRDSGDALETPIIMPTTLLGANTVASFFNGSREHRLVRDNDVQNIELNWLHGPLVGGVAPSCVTWLAGIRYFQFDESLLFGAVSGGNEFGSGGGVNEAYVSNNVRNRLLGGQIGARANYLCNSRFQLFASPTVGLYGNHITKHNRIYRGDGLEAVNQRTSKDDFAVLSQLDIGANYCLSPCWSLTAGYRLVAVSGLALSDNQIPGNFTGPTIFPDIASNGNLLLHGVFAGVTCRY